MGGGMTDLSFLRRPQVATKIGVSVPTLERMVADGRFPLPFQIGENSVAWRSDEVEAWMAERPRAKITVEKPYKLQANQQ